MSTSRSELVTVSGVIEALARKLFPSYTEGPYPVLYKHGYAYLQDPTPTSRSIVFPLFWHIYVVVEFQLKSVILSESLREAVVMQKPRLVFARFRREPSLRNDASRIPENEVWIGPHQDASGSGRLQSEIPNVVPVPWSSSRDNLMLFESGSPSDQRRLMELMRRAQLRHAKGPEFPGDRSET